MARVLIVGDSERSLVLARSLQEHQVLVRVLTEDAERLPAIEEAGAEGWVGDPDRLGTIIGALDGVSVACWLLGTAGGPLQRLQALHGPRLESFILEAVDSPLRAFIYEAAGTVPSQVLAGGAQSARRIAAQNSIPLAVIDADPAELDRWVGQALAALRQLLGM